MASAAGIRLGKVFVEIGADPSKLFGALNKLNKRIGSIGQSMTNFGGRMTAIGGALAAPLALASRQFASFDDAIRATAAVTGSLGPQGAAALAMLNDKARELGATTSFTAVQVANLMTELGRAGFKPDEINNMTGAVLDLARATGTDATLSAGIMAATLRQFGMGASDAARAADVLTYAANSSFNTVEGLGESLKFAGPVAKNLGMSLEDTVGILGVLGNVGIQGSEAGTALRRLGVISAGSGKQLQQLFGISNTDAEGNLKPLVDILDEINTATSTMSVAERTEKMAKAFGLLGITSANVLAGSAPSVRAFIEGMNDIDRLANTTAKAMDAGLGGSMRIAMSAIEGTALAIGDALAPSLQKLIDGIARTAGDISQFVKQNQEVIVVVAQVVAGVMLGGGAMLIFGKALSVVSVALGVATTAGNALVIAATLLATTSSTAATGLATLLGATTKLIVSFAGLVAGAAAYAAKSVAAAATSAAAWAVAHAPLAIIGGMFAMFAAVLLPAVATEAGKAFGRMQDSAAASVSGFDAIREQFAPLGQALDELAGTAIKAGGRIYEALSTGDIVGAWSAAVTAISQMFVTLGSNWQKYVTNPIKLQGELIASASREKDILDQFSFGRSTTGTDRERRAMAGRILGTRSLDDLEAELASQQDSQTMASLLNATQSAKDSVRNPALQQLKALREAEALARERFAAAGIVSEEGRLADVRKKIADLDAQFQQGQDARQGVRDDVASVSDIQQSLATAKSGLDLQLLGGRIADIIERDNLTADQERKLLQAFNDASVRLSAVATEPSPGSLQTKTEEPPPEIDPEKLKLDVQRAAADQSEAVGTFSSVGLGGLGFGGNLQQRIADAAERTAKATEEIAAGGGGEIEL